MNKHIQGLQEQEQSEGKRNNGGSDDDEHVVGVVVYLDSRPCLYEWMVSTVHCLFHPLLLVSVPQGILSHQRYHYLHLNVDDVDLRFVRMTVTNFWFVGSQTYHRCRHRRRRCAHLHRHHPFLCAKDAVDYTYSMYREFFLMPPMHLRNHYV